MDVGFDVWVLGVDAVWVDAFERGTPFERWERLMAHERLHPGGVSFSDVIRHSVPENIVEECKACGDNTLKVIVSNQKHGKWVAESIDMRCPCGYIYESSSRHYDNTVKDEDNLEEANG